MLSIVGGIAVGLVVGYVIRRVRRALDNPPLEVTIAFLTGYFAFLPATAIGVSGVLAVVTAGVYMGWYTPELTTVQTRLQGQGFWEVLTFLLNVLLFGLDRAAAAADPRRALRARRLVARRRRGPDRAGGDRPPDRLGLSRRPTSRAGCFRAHPRARPVAAVALSRLHRLERHARRGDDRRGAAHPAAHRRRARRFPAAT